MKKLLSTKYSAGSFNFATLILRLTLGIVMVYYGYKLMSHFGENKAHGTSILGMSREVSLLLMIFVKLACGLLLVLGLFSRIAALLIFLYMGYALYSQYHLDVFGSGTFAMVFFGGSLVLLLLGPGKYSIDSAMGR